MNMKFRFIPVIVSGLMLACSNPDSENSKKDVSTDHKHALSDQLLTDSVEIEILEPDVFLPEKGLSSSQIFKSILEHYSIAYHVQENSRLILPDRFSATEKIKFSLARKQEVVYQDSLKHIPVADLWYFEYDDTSRIKNVIRNWFLEYGDSRTELIEGESTFVKSKPSMIIIDPRKIVVLQTDCLAYNDFNWKKLYQSFYKAFKNSESKTIEVNCNGYLTWK